MKLHYVTLSAIGLIAGFLVGPAAAATVTLGQAELSPCIGQNSCTIGGGLVTITAASNFNYNIGGVAAPIGSSIYRDQFGLGVGPANGTNRNAEIRGDRNESLTFLFNTPSFVSGVTLAHFYNTTAFSNDPLEVALIEATGANGTSTLSIQNTGYSVSGGVRTPTLTTTITGFGGTANVLGVPFTGAAGSAANKGLVTIADLFLELGPLTRLVFSADGAPFGSDGSDYSIAALTVAPVPLPAAVWMLLAGLGGLGLFGRKRATA